MVSDTHNRLPNIRSIVDLFNEAEVDLVIHTGDVASAGALRAFADLAAPMLGVWGNNDEPREQLRGAALDLGFHFFEPPHRLELAGVRLLLGHDPEELAIQSGDELVLHGHTHRHRLERSTGQLIFNPGECAGHMKGYNAVGLVELPRLEAELLKF